MRSTVSLFGLIAFFMFAGNTFANNVTVSGAFDGTEPTMSAAPDSCPGVDVNRFRVAGTITVSSSGSYRFADAGNYFSSYYPQGDIADSVIMIYSGSFDSNNPANNRVASVDEYDDVPLNTGTSYTLVVQHWCEEINGPYAFVIEGQGTVSGDGFTSPAQTIGDFNAGSPTAYFADLDAVVRYRADPKVVDQSGNYYFVDIGEETGGSYMVLRIYENSFDPQNTETNLVYNSNLDSEWGFIGSFLLQAGVNYVFVLAEYTPNSPHVQYVLYPPGPFNFNPGLNGSWTTPGVKAQGILVDVVASQGVLFFAQFTFQDDVVAAATKGGGSTVQSSGGGGSKVQAVIGADDQIWLTAFGLIPDTGNTMTISYENSTGGRFNSETPEATTDSNYGTGYVEGISCDHLVVNWNLPGGVVDTRDYYKAAQDTVPYCQSFAKAAPVSPNW